MATQGQVTKIYRLETVGYNDLHNQFLQLSKDLLAIKKLIVDLQGQSIGLKGDDLVKVNAQIKEALNLNDQLEQQVESLNGTTDKSVSKYFELSKAYKQAKESAQDLAAEFGVESEQAKAAAESAAALKQQLTDINNLVKAGGKPQAPVVPLVPEASASGQPQNVEVITNTDDLEKQKELLQQTGDAVLEVKTKYEQYTGSLRENHIAQIDIINQLERNRDAQKAIQSVISAQGSATQQQTDQLAALRQEEQILIETNKDLTVTIRNQTKEFIATTNSLDQFQAQLNQLQQQYEKLNDVQKASPLGQQLKKDIDDLLPKVKESEESIGRFSRNVGNYQGSAKIIVDALKSVESEISSLQQKQQGLVDFSKRNPVGFKVGGGQENLNQVTGQLNALQKQATALNQVTANPQFLNIASKVGDNRAEIRFFTNQLSELRESGLAASDVFKQIETRLAELTKDSRETRESIKALSSETRGFDLFASSVNFLSSTFETAAGAESLFGKTTEESQKKTQQLVAVIALANGTREIARQITEKGTAANKIYNFVLQNTKNVLDANATSATRWTSALKLGIAGIAVGAIILLIQNLDKLDDKQKRLAENFNSLTNTNQLTIDKLKEYGDTIDKVSEGAIKSLDDQIKSLNTELGKQPSLLAESTAAMQLNKNEIERLTRSLDEFQTIGNRSLRESLGNVIPFIGGGTADKLKAAQKNLEELQKKVAQFNALQAQSSIAAHENADIEAFNRIAELQIDSNNRVLNNTRSTEQQKLASVNSTFLQRKAIINNNLQIELNNNQSSLLKQNQARDKANAELLKNERDKNDQLRNLNEQFSKTDLENANKNIDTLKDQQLADEQKKRLQNLEDEQTYLTNILKINQDAIDKKIAILKRGATDETKLSADTQKQIAQLNLEKVKEELDTQQKLLDIKNKAFQEQRALQIEAFENQKAQIELERDRQLKDPTISETDKVEIRRNSDQQLLDLQLQLNAKTDELEKQLGVKSLKNARENAQALLRIQEQLLSDLLAITDARLKEIDKVAGTVDDKIRIAASEKVTQILDSNKSDIQKAREIQALKNELAHDQLTIEVNRLKQETEAFKDGVRDKLKTEKDYYDALAVLKDKEAALEEQNVQRQLTAWQRFVNALKDFRDGFAANVLGIKQYAKDAEGQAEKTADAVAETERNVNQVITEVFNNYFTNKKAQIDQQTTVAEKQLDVEKQQVEARAQSQAEITSIDKQYAVKKDEIQRAAGEQKKKLALKELAIDYAISVVKSLAQYGFPLALLPIAAETALYFVQRANIQKQQFAYGGKPGAVPLRGGKFGGQPHSKGGTDFDFKGKTYNAEIDELSVIRTRNAPKGKRYTITGTQSQIASAANVVGGGVDFAPGAKVEEHKKGFANTVKNIFGFGGTLREQKDKVTNEKTQRSNIHEHYSRIADHVMNENKALVESRNISTIVDQVMNRVSFRDNTSRDTITKIVTSKIDQYNNTVSTTSDRKNSFTNTIKKIFAIGGILTDERNKVSNAITTEQKTSSDLTSHFSSVIDRVMTDNKNLFETKNTNAIVSAVITNSSFEKKNITRENIHAIAEIVNEKVNAYHNKIYSVTGTTKQVYSSLGIAAKEQFAFGGTSGEVPVKGGKFGGRSHAFGGTDFFFKGKKYNAEVDELAIIRTRNADRLKKYTVTGNQMQIASFANMIGGGINFKPGAAAKTFASGGFLGSSLQAPIFTPSNFSNANNEALLSEIKKLNEKVDQQTASNLQLAEATSKRIDNIKTFVVEKEITDTQNKAKKQTSIGTIS
jgi:hypothetical protein